jgi:enediyne biosynthesis protein E4
MIRFNYSEYKHLDMRITLLTILAVSIAFSCNRPKESALFTLLPPSSTGIDFENRLNETEAWNIIEYLYFNNGAGVAAGDINNDGLVDLYFPSNQEGNKLYLNKGGLEFEDITEKAGVAGTGDWNTGVSMADVNGDGLLDIYLCNVGGYKGLTGHNQLYINQGNLTFREESEAYGLDFTGFSTQAAFFDYDLDGDLDIYLLNHSVHTSRSYGMADLRLEKDPLAGDRLYRNDPTENGRIFHEVNEEAGIFASQIGYGLGVNTSDINGDGYPDIYVSNDFHENDYLYINNGDGTFSERLTEMIAHTSRSSMGNDVADFNNDGLADIMVLDMLPDDEKILKQSGTEDELELFRIKLLYGYAHQYVHNTLQLNLGNGLFSEIGRLAGIYATDWSWSALFCDMDNDGWKDLFITNGIYRRPNDLDYVNYLTGGNRYFPTKNTDSISDMELIGKMPLQPDINHIFRNNGDLTFSSMGETWGFDTPDYSNGSACADLDNDGDMELIVNNINGPASIYRNNAERLPGRHFLQLQLEGNEMNRDGIGAVITLSAGGRQQMVQQVFTRGFMSSSSDGPHFGLGSDTIVDSLTICWPGSLVQKLYHVRTDQELVLRISDAVAVTQTEKTGVPRTLFSPDSVPGLQFRHIENEWEDLDREFLVPANLSAEGPAMAVGDVNGDGLDDLFMGGATDQASRLFIQLPGGSFQAAVVPDLMRDRFTEDVDAAFFDADGDGDPDLYIVRGGNQEFAGSPLLADRLLVNNGRGAFEHSPPGAIPLLMQNGSCVRPSDFDGDGDTDLFIGTRSIPGAYGVSPEQFLLENDGSGRFTPVAAERLGDLYKAGMVTDACWIDQDLDGDPDLVVVGEWMNVSIFRNDGETFTNITGTAGLEETSGWWNCISAADLDQDGDLDLVGGNLGLNSMLKASATEPVELWLNDFDNNGIPDPIICRYNNGTSYPIATLDELKRQIIGIGQRYPAYSDFGEQTVTDIFGQEALSKSLHKKAVLFESAVFLNRGDGTYETNPLPVEAQFSPVRSIQTGDFNGDGITDLIIAGNNYSTRPSLGRQDASYGWFLQGTVNKTYEVRMPAESGFLVTGDTRKMHLVEIEGKPYLIVAPNNDQIQLFKSGTYCKQ